VQIICDLRDFMISGSGAQGTPADQGRLVPKSFDGRKASPDQLKSIGRIEMGAAALFGLMGVNALSIAWSAGTAAPFVIGLAFLCAGSILLANGIKRYRSGRDLQELETPA